MTPSATAALLSAAIVARRPVLLTGAPGVGKSDIVAQAAHASDCDLIVSHPVVADPTDAKGLPWPVADQGEATFLPFGDLARAIRATQPTVWLLDDLGQAPPAVQASYMQLLLARRCNGHALSEHVVMVANSNRRSDRAGVTGMLEPVKSRFATIIELTADLDEWCQWALAHGISPMLVAFLRFRPDLLCDFRPAGDMSQSPTPRTWANAAEVERWALPRAIEAEALAGAIGQGPATEYLSFRAIASAMVSVDDILLDPTGAPLPDKPAECYAVATALAAKATAGNFARVAQYLERLHAHGKGEFCALSLRDISRRDKEIKFTAAWQALAVGGIGQLIVGGAQ